MRLLGRYVRTVICDSGLFFMSLMTFWGVGLSGEKRVGWSSFGEGPTGLALRSINSRGGTKVKYQSAYSVARALFLIRERAFRLKPAHRIAAQQ